MDPHNDLPPTYNEATTTTTASSTSSPLNLSHPPRRIHPLPSPLTAHLRTLPARLRQAQHARLTAQAARDLDLVTERLVPPVEAFLAGLTGVPGVAALTLVPGAAVPRGGLRAPREAAGFDGWGRFDTDDAGGGPGDGERVTEAWWWFRDEAMARRLALYLRPEPDLGRRRVQAVVVEQKAAKSIWPWSRRKSTGGQTSPTSPTLPSPGLPSPGEAEADDSVTMTVRADEVTFRKENAFGVWESRTGFGIVVTVRVRA
ncbi:hypothetical protein BT67DRAFT_457551 [Trichocladium antarcticum]|uniref:Uncharacterized protein n=1 Tax=Trichocladium antarcticum TaxID=1450529 RepID=A0AAN6UGD0_9PEZI|nr:hypothetical protein BT67DRAFT_457551 [Trichocladium antarcticum]